MSERDAKTALVGSERSSRLSLSHGSQVNRRSNHGCLKLIHSMNLNRRDDDAGEMDQGQNAQRPARHSKAGVKVSDAQSTIASASGMPIPARWNFPNAANVNMPIPIICVPALAASGAPTFPIAWAIACDGLRCDSSPSR